MSRKTEQAPNPNDANPPNECWQKKNSASKGEELKGSHSDAQVGFIDECKILKEEYLAILENELPQKQRTEHGGMWRVGKASVIALVLLHKAVRARKTFGVSQSAKSNYKSNQGEKRQTLSMERRQLWSAKRN